MSNLAILSVIAFSLSGVFFALSVFLWFKLGIRRVIGNLTGKTEKRTIEEMKGKHQGGSSQITKERIKKPEGKKKVEKSTVKTKKSRNYETVSPKTMPLDEFLNGKTEDLIDNFVSGRETELLNASGTNQEGTALLNKENLTGNVTSQMNETSLLGGSMNEMHETMILSTDSPLYDEAAMEPKVEDIRSDQTVILSEDSENGGSFEMLDDIMLIHTDEEIDL